MANIFNEQIPVGETADTPTGGLDPRLLPRPVPAEDAQAIGNYMIERYRKAAAERGHAAVAGQLRKQGFPLEITQLILFGSTK